MPFIKEGCNYIVTNRTVNPQRVNLLFNIPANEEVLVVNVLYESAVDLINELKAIGISHIKLHPYDPQKPLEKEFTIAITPGEGHLVPQNIQEVIDIGDRLISISTISQIIFCLTGKWMDDTLINSRYIQNYVKLSMHLAEQVRHNQMLRRQREIVLANFEDGVLLADKKGIVTYHNTKALELLAEEHLVGKPLEQLFAMSYDNATSQPKFLYPIRQSMRRSCLAKSKQFLQY